MNRDILSRRLARQGHQVLLAESGEEGLRLAVQTRPNLILMDIGLPGMSGLEATRLLRSDPVTSAIPVIAITAHALQSDRKLAQEAGCDEFETKPIDFQRLLMKIEATTQQVRA